MIAGGDPQSKLPGPCGCTREGRGALRHSPLVLRLGVVSGSAGGRHGQAEHAEAKRERGIARGRRGRRRRGGGVVDEEIPRSQGGVQAVQEEGDGCYSGAAVAGAAPARSTFDELSSRQARRSSC